MTDKILLRARTAHTGLRIERQGDERLLRFDGDREAIQSAIAEKQPHVLRMQNLRYLMGILMLLPRPKNILLLGVGGGALIHFLRYYLPEATITAVDYDAELLELAKQHLGLPESDEHLKYAVADAREYLKFNEARHDLIVVDIFKGPYSPAWLLTRDVTQLLYQRLNAQGGIAYNLLIHKEKTFSDFYRQLRQTFARQTLCLETPEYQNLLVYGLKTAPPQNDMTYWMLQAQQASEQFELPFNEILAEIYSINPVDSGII